MKRIGIYVGKNLLRIILLLFAVSILTFALVSASPIDPLQANVGQAALVSMSEEQKEKLQELANLYKEKYPNLVKTDGMAMGFADAEVAGQAVRTENGIMLIACNGLNYMDNVDPSKSWHIMYSINDTDMYKKIMNAMTEGYIIGKDIENVSKWEKYFEEKELSYERILSDEELELLQMNKI